MNSLKIFKFVTIKLGKNIDILHVIDNIKYTNLSSNNTTINLIFLNS